MIEWTEDEIRRQYVAEGSLRRAATALGLSVERVAATVADLVASVSHERRSMNARRTNALVESDRMEAAASGCRWRCACGCLAQGETCHRGHPAPWKEEG